MFSACAILAVITTAADLRRAVWEDSRSEAPFSITGTVTAATSSNNSYWLMDETGFCYVRATNRISLAVGDRVRADGHIGVDRYRWQRAFLESAAVLGRDELPSPIVATGEQLGDVAFDNRHVVMNGIVTDVIRDEIDPHWQFLVFRSETGPFLAAVQYGTADRDLGRLIGAVVSAKGIANVLPDGGKRKFKTPQLTIAHPSDITVLAAAPEDPFAVPQILKEDMAIENLQYKSASHLARMNRRRAEGYVIAVAHGRRLLLKTGAGRFFSATLSADPLPGCGDRVAVVGFPETDLFILNLSKAIFKPLPPTEAASTHTDRPPIPLSESFDMDKVLRECYGQVVALSGTVVSVPPDDKGNSYLLMLACGNRIIPVDTTSCLQTSHTISLGSKIEATGVCLINTANWNPHDPFPRINGFTLVPRSSMDLHVLSSPSWWTAERLLVLVAVLVLALIVIVVWNRTLHRLVDRRSRQLFKTEIAKAEADLRVNERTRLAVDLHDSISQTLTGVSFQIDAARQTLPAHAERASGFLAVATRMLQSCREELRRCLWDLRSNTLETGDFTEAVKRTVSPGARDAVVSVRFNIRRALLSDTTAHAVLNIVRELTVNAVRHGHAQHVRVAGEQKDGTVRFSVSDDGCGFVPSECPGPNEGHFGLQGIRERINRLGGKIEIASKMGKGTKVTVEIGK